MKINEDLLFINHFEAITKLHSNKDAVIFNAVKLTYEELNKSANQLAHSLQDKGFNKGDHVVVKLPPSCNAIIAILGLMKAGMVYIPIPVDTDISEERLNQITGDCKPKFIISQENIEDLLINTKQENPNIDIKPTDLAYIMYSSGTMGRPKGVMIEHKGLCAVMKSHHDVMEIESHDCIAQFASLGFDASLMEIIIALGKGAKLCIVPANLRQRIEGLCKYYDEHNVSMAIFTPTMMQNIAPNALPKLKVVIAMGEKISQRLLGEWSLARKVIIGYGPTETTIAASLAIYKPGEPMHAGKPVIGLQFFIINAGIEVAEEGVGELCIAGNNLAKGYINDAKLTQERFLEIVHPQDPSKKIFVYKTGDLARLTKDGNLEIKERIGRQVKIYGKLVEPGAIDEVLQQDNKIKLAYTHVDFNDCGHPTITSYLIPKASVRPEAIDLLALHNLVKSQLSQTVAPTRFIFSEKVPINERGKFDANELKKNSTAINLIRPIIKIKFDSNDIQKKLTAIWNNVLNITIDEFYLQDNFFYLGGTSLLVINLLAQIKELFNINISLNDFMVNPTFSNLARKILQVKLKDQIETPIIKISERGEEPPLFFIHTLFSKVQEDYEKFSKQWAGKKAIYGINPYGIQDKRLADETIKEAARNYLRIIREKQPEGPYIIVGWSLGGMIAYEIAQQLQDKKQKAAVIMIDTEAPQCLQIMTETQFMNHLVHLYARLSSHFGIKVNFDRHDLADKNKYQQIDVMFEHVLTYVKSDQHARLWAIRCFLIAALDYQVEPNSFDCILIAATETQKKWNARLKWPDNVRLKNIIPIEGDHSSIFSQELPCKNLAGYVNKYAKRLESKFKFSSLIKDLKARYLIEKFEEPEKEIAYIPNPGSKVLIHGEMKFNKKICSQQAYQWAKGELANLFELAIVIDAEKLTSALYASPEVTLADILQRQCVGSLGKQLEPNIFSVYLRRFLPEIVFIIQNYDPNNMEPRCKEILDDIIINHPKASVIITSEFKLDFNIEIVTVQAGFTPLVAQKQTIQEAKKPTQSGATLLSQYGFYVEQPVIMEEVTAKTDANILAVDRSARMSKVKAEEGSANIVSIPKDISPDILQAVSSLPFFKKG